MTAPEVQHGIVTAASTLVSTTNDGVDLNVIWQEIIDAFTLVSNERTSIVNLLGYNTIVTGEATPQNSESPSFERATEIGIPRSVAPPSNALLMGFDFRDFDLSTRMTWRFLRDANADQVRATVESIIAADNKLVTGTVLRQLFTNVARKNEFGATVFPLWNGADGYTPPSYMGKTFSDTETHFIVSGAATLDSADIEDCFHLVQDKGYGHKENGSQLVVLANPAESELIQGWRAGVASRESGPKAKFDYIPSVSAPAYLTPDNIVGPIAPATFYNLSVLGSYGPALLIESYFVPAGYVAVFATGGPDSTQNVIGLRNHANPAYRGLRQIAGNSQYPIVESFSQRSFGVGVRQRGAAAIVQVKASGNYDNPSSLIPV